MKTLRNIFYQIFSLLYFLAGFGQKVPLQKVGELDDRILECSGVTQIPGGHLAMINDSGNKPEVFFTDPKGKVLGGRCLSEVENFDWEEITYYDGFLYIGDFGNNKNKRKNLVIYKYKLGGPDSLTYWGELHFKYADQQEFPPDEEFQNYDMEAMVHYHDSIFIFTKNRTKPFTGYTYQYGMPDKPGNYTLTRLDSFLTGYGDQDLFWVSGAALNYNTNVLALLGYDKMWVFKDYSGARFFSGKHKTYSFEFLSQKESIAFLNDNELVITDEKNLFGGGIVYHASLPSPELDKKVQPYDTSFFELDILNTEFQDSIVVLFPNFYEGKVLWEIFKTDGNRVKAGNTTLTKDFQKVVINTRDLSPGGYVLNVIVEGHPHAFKLRKLYPLSEDPTTD